MQHNSANLIGQLQTTLGKMEVALGAIDEAIAWTDGEGKIQWSNATFDRLVNRQRFDILGASVFDLLPLQQQQFSLEDHPINRALQGQVHDTDIYEFRQAERKFILEISSACIQFKGRETSAVLVIRDITKRQHMEAALAQSEAKFRSLIQNSSDLIVILGTDGIIQYASPSHEKILGYKPNQLIGKNALKSIHPKDASKAVTVFRRSIQDPSSILDLEFRFKRKDGSWRFLESTINNLLADPSVGAMVLNARDVTERKRAKEQLLYNAFHDPLTNLPNRALFMNRLERAVDRAKRDEDYLFAVLFIDLDRFKLINDSLGHTFGDKLLVAIASRLQTCLRFGDPVARLGGDEFTILLEDIQDVSDAVNVAERVLAQLRLIFELEGREVFVTASIGIAVSTADYDRPEAALRDADIAMYRAKLLGKARYEIFNLEMHTRAMMLLRLETDLRLAIERQEFQLYYQPIVSLSTGQINGFEALVRWDHPLRGLVSPAQFIPVAEETGLIMPIGQWGLKQACRQLRVWQLKFPSLPLTISVNISGKQFSQPDLVQQIGQALQETNLDARSLKLEITESILMENTESAVAMLRELKKMNIQLYMDDFGTGYSSLSYLHRFPIDQIKIDRSFINSMGIDRKNSAIVEAIVTLAHNLGKDVTAEGIEKAEQLAKLRQLGCEYGQGYFFSKAVDAKGADALLAKQPKWLQQFEPETSRQRDSVNELPTISRNNLPMISNSEKLCK